MLNRLKKRGFTLVELLVVIAIIGILIALLLPALNTVRESARRSLCSGNHKQIGTAINTYYEAQKTYPPGAWYPAEITGTETYTSRAYASALPAWESNASPTAANSAPYSFFVKLLPFLEQNHIFDGFNFAQSAYSTSNAGLTDDVIPSLLCPSFTGSSDSTGSTEPDAALTQYKSMGATTKSSISDSSNVTNTTGAGGAMHPYGTLRAIAATTQTAFLTETRETDLAGWADGATSCLYGLSGSSTASTPGQAKVNNADSPLADPEEATYDGAWGAASTDMKWGPSSEHPGLTLHSFGDTNTRGVRDDITVGVYEALISRKDGDNGQIGNWFSQ